jgi:hypothetical protein
MLNVFMLNIIVQNATKPNVKMLNVIANITVLDVNIQYNNAECQYGQYNHAECQCVQYNCAECHHANVIIQNAIMI